MIKIFLITALIAFIVFDVILVFSSLVISGDSKEIQHKHNTKNQLCPQCRVGKESYRLDKRSEICPYISCYKKGKCSAFAPINEEKNKAEKV